MEDSDKSVKEQLELFQLILNNTNSIIWAVDLDYRLLFANKSYQNALLAAGGKEMVKGQNVLSDEYPNEFINFWKNNYDSSFKGEYLLVESNMNWQDGLHYIENSINPIKNESGKIIGAVVTSLDITERKLAQFSFKESEEKWHTLFEILPVGVSILDKEGQITEFNSALEQILDITKEGLKDKIYNSRKYFHADNLPFKTEDYPSYNAINRQETTRDVEICIEKENDVTIWTKVSAAPLDFPDAACVVVTSDITERKMAEKKIIESQRLNAIGEMASAVAHDFNNSLQAMLSTINIAMLQSDMPVTANHLLSKVESIIIDVAERVQLLQRYGDKKQFQGENKPLNINTIIKECIKQFSPFWKDEAEKKGLSIKITTQFDSNPIINGVKGDLKSVFLNLFKNSIEAMPNGGNINIETGIKYNKVFFIVKDTGVGMDDETKLRIFQPFYTTKGFDVGRGLGMTGVYSIIKENGGDIFIKSSEKDKGTEIEINYPLYIHEDKIVEQFAKDKMQLRILWVEDDKTISENAKMIVDFMGHKCDTANSGLKALEALKKNKYDIVITDIGMPEMNGWQLINKIKESYGDKMEFVVVTGWSSEIGEQKLKEHGVKYLLGKPFTIDQLEKIIDEILNLNR